MKRTLLKPVLALAFLGMALGSQACNLTVDLPKTLPSLFVTGSVAPASPRPSVDGAPTCAKDFQSYDSDGDGALDLSEFNLVVNPPFVGCPVCGAPAMRDPAPILQKYDRNHDGKLQQDEFCAYRAGVPLPSPAPTATPTPFIIIEPPPPTLPPSPSPTVAPTATPNPKPTTKPNPGLYTATPAAFDDLDTDKDGKISWDEEVAYQSRNGALPAGAKDQIYDLFRQADTNGNGTLERSEYDFARS